MKNCSIVGFHSSFISPASSLTSSFNENPLDLSQQHAQQHIPILSQSPQFSSSPHQHPSTIPIRIPSSNIPIPPGSLPHITGILPITQSHSLPAYFFPQGNLTYLITNPNSTQPLHLLRSLNPSSIISSPYSTMAFSVVSNEFQAKQTEEQLPFKKRRYNVGQSAYSPMDTNHDDDETSNDSMKK